MSRYKYPIVLSIAGSDSGGGAGIQADIKTISALGCFAATAITAVTAQNTLGVTAIHLIPPEIVTAQIKAVMDDIKPSAIKIGMVPNAGLAIAIASVLRDYPGIPIVFDPVMVASSGDRLIEGDMTATFKKELFPLAHIVTPNLDEAGMLTDMPINNIVDMKKAAARILTLGCNSVLLKGGHLQGADLYDVYLDKNNEEHIFRSKALQTPNTHGTGCTLSSAIAAHLALGNHLVTSITKGKMYVQKAIEQGIDVKTGEGHGPLNHFFDPDKLVKYIIK